MWCVVSAMLWPFYPLENSVKVNVKVPLQAWSGAGTLQEFRAPRYHDNGTGWW